MSAAIRWTPVFVGLVLICVAVSAQPPAGFPTFPDRGEGFGQGVRTASATSAPVPNFPPETNFPRESGRQIERGNTEVRELEIKAPVVAESNPGKAQVQLVSQLVEGAQQVVILDSRTHALAVYRVDPKTGEIGLQSVRRIEWDLQMEQFNGSAPSPEHIRSLLMPASR